MNTENKNVDFNEERQAFIKWAVRNQYDVSEIENAQGVLFKRQSTTDAWLGWLYSSKAKAEKLERCSEVPESDFALLPKTITPEIEEILGMPCFKFIKAAQIYRQHGFEIQPKAEKEQAFFIFKILHLALIHGDKCFDVFESETKAIVEGVRGNHND